MWQVSNKIDWEMSEKWKSEKRHVDTIKTVLSLNTFVRPACEVSHTTQYVLGQSSQVAMSGINQYAVSKQN